MAIITHEFVVGTALVFIYLRCSPYISFSSRLLRGVTYFLPLSEDALKRLDTKSQSKKSKDGSTEDVQVLYGEIDDKSLLRHWFFDQYDTLVFLAICSAVLFFYSEIFSGYMGVPPGDSSSYALTALALYALYALLTIVLQQGIEAHEFRICFFIGFVGFVLSLPFLFMPEAVLDFQMEQALNDLTERSQLLFQHLSQNRHSGIQLHPDLVRFALAVFSGMLSAALFLPSFRFARIFEAMDKAKWYYRSLAVLNVALPAMIVICWIKPLTRDALLDKRLVHCEPTAIYRDCIRTVTQTMHDGELITSSVLEPAPYMTESMWVRSRLVLVLLAVLARCLFFREYIRRFLWDVKDVIVRKLRRPMEVDTEKLQMQIRSQYSYICVAAIQFLSPTCFLAALAFMLKRKAGIDLGICSGIKAALERFDGAERFVPACSPYAFPVLSQPNVTPLDLTKDTTREQLAAFVKGIGEYVFVSPHLYSAILSFLLWWTATVFVVLAIVGVLYFRKNPDHDDYYAKKQRIDRTTKPKNKSKTAKKEA